MGEVFVRALLDQESGVESQESGGEKQLLVCDKKKKILDRFRKLGTRTTSDIKEAVDYSEVIIIAIKPQDFKKLIKSIKGNVKDKILISIMAGVNFKTLSKTRAKRIIRAMPNQPAKVGAGMTVWAVNRRDKDLIALGHSIFSSLGKELYINKRGKDADKMLNAATAISGSGPAYFYYFAEQLEKEARKLGFSKDETREIVAGTISGAARIIEQSSNISKERKAVTSKGGTTEVALKHLSKKKAGDNFRKAVSKANKRAKELNK